MITPILNFTLHTIYTKKYAHLYQNAPDYFTLFDLTAEIPHVCPLCGKTLKLKFVHRQHQFHFHVHSPIWLSFLRQII